MARSGDTIVNPIMGAKIVFRQTAEETKSELLQFEFFLQPNRVVMGFDHVHPQMQESFQVISGSVRGRLAGQEREVAAGESVVAPPGTPHVWWNGGADEAHLLVEFRPALQMEGLLETAFALSHQQGTTDAHGIPTMMYRALMTQKFGNLMYPAFPPRWIQKTIMNILAPIARLRGYRLD
jgi:quercetin dioxygenase-like cupin family protein